MAVKRSVGGNPALRRGSELLTVPAAMAKPDPSTGLPLGVRSIREVLIPTTLPSIVKSGPPLLPGLIAASVWISQPSPAWSIQTAEMTPLVTVALPTPSGYPIANTLLPSVGLACLFSDAAWKRVEQQMLRAARSLSASKPRSVAL